MVQTYKIVRDIDIVDKDKLFTIATETRTRGHKYKLFQRRSRLNIRKNVFSNRVVDTWNNLPSSVVEAPSVNSFKSRLNRHWTNHPSKFNPPCYIPHATGQIARYSQQCSNGLKKLKWLNNGVFYLQVIYKLSTRSSIGH